MRNVLEQIAVMTVKVDHLQDRSQEHEWRFGRLEDMVSKYIQLHLEATEADYQDRLWLMGLDDIKKYTLAEVESARFMSDRQFNNLRASKREEDSND
jgi:hypothetical protein